ncbi:MAG: immunity 22 family protein [Arenicella sp.]
MEPNNLCRSLIVYGSYAPGGVNHNIFSDLPGEWVKGKIVAAIIGPDEIAPGETDITEAWMMTFSDCNAEMFTPEWDKQEALLHSRWQQLDHRMGEQWARDSRRWWPDESEPEIANNGMVVVNIYLPVKTFQYLPPAISTHKPLGQKVLDIWVGFFDSGYQGKYFEEKYNEDDDSPISEFASDQGKIWIDHDFMEVGHKDFPKNISDLVQGYSWSDQYAEELAQRVEDSEITRFNSFVLLDAGQIESPCSVYKKGIDLNYMGRFMVKV